MKALTDHGQSFCPPAFRAWRVLHQCGSTDDRQWHLQKAGFFSGQLLPIRMVRILRRPSWADRTGFSVLSSKVLIEGNKRTRRSRSWNILAPAALELFLSKCDLLFHFT